MPEYTPTGGELAAAVPFAGISVPGDSIFDDIFDWVANVIPSVINAIGDNIVKVINAIGENVALVVTSVASGFSQVTRSIFMAAAVLTVIVSNSVIDVIDALGTNISLVQASISSAVSQIASSLASGISSVVTDVYRVTAVLTTIITNSINSVITNIANEATRVITAAASGLEAVMTTVGVLVAGVSQTIVTTFRAISAQVEADFDWITDWLAVSIPKILGSWWDAFLAKVLDFPAWVGKLLDSVAAWMSRDVPGQSPWWQYFLDALSGWATGNLDKWIQDVSEIGIKYILPRVMVILQPIGELFNTVADEFLTAVSDYIQPLGPMDPSMGLDNFRSLSRVGMVALAGLAGMTVAGSWLKPLGEAGMGQIAAMIYDMTNYKSITAAFMTVLTYATVRAPLGYYFNAKFRPNIPSIRDASDMYTQERITKGMFGQLLAYHGIPDSWHDAYADIGYRGVSPFTLRSLAESGSFDRELMMSELTSSGYRPEIKALLLDAYQKASTANVKTVMVASATGRFKAGITTEEQLTAELKILNVGDNLIPLYLQGARLDYATAYINDLISANDAAVLSGQIDLNQYRDNLLGFGLVPERVMARVLVNNVKLRAKYKPGIIAAPKPTYQTEAGRIEVDTIRKERLLGILDRASEQAQLVALGMDSELAGTIARNDDTAIAERVATPSIAVLPRYLTDAGKVAVDTIRRNRRRGLIDHGAETTQLMALGMPADLAEAYAANDDLRSVKE